jgi:hypothetical protein
MTYRNITLEELAASLVAEHLMRPLSVPNIWKMYDKDSQGWEGWPVNLIDMHEADNYPR